MNYVHSLQMELNPNSHSFSNNKLYELFRMGETGKVDFPFGGSMAVAQPMQVSSPSSFDSPEPKLEADSAAQTAISAGMSGGSLTNETVSRKALDKVILVLYF